MARGNLAETDARPDVLGEATIETLDLRAAYYELSGRLRAFLQRAGWSAADADDLVSETFLIAHQRLDQFDPARPVFPWLIGIAINRARNLRRRRWFRSLLTLGLRNEPARESERDPEQAMIEAEDADRVRRALAMLSERKRMILVLREFEHLSAKQIAEVLNLDPASVHSTLHHVRKDFLKKYRQLLFLESVR